MDKPKRIINLIMKLTQQLDIDNISAPQQQSSYTSPLTSTPYKPLTTLPAHAQNTKFLQTTAYNADNAMMTSSNDTINNNNNNNNNITS
eukprot:UN08981